MEKISSSGNLKRSSSRDNLGTQSQMPQSERKSRSTSHLAQLANDKVTNRFGETFTRETFGNFAI